MTLKLSERNRNYAWVRPTGLCWHYSLYKQWYKTSFNIGVSASVNVHHILHSLSSVIPSGAVSVSAMLLEGWEMKGATSAQELKKIPKEAGLHKCLEGEGGRYYLAQTSEPQFELG